MAACSFFTPSGVTSVPPRWTDLSFFIDWTSRQSRVADIRGVELQVFERGMCLAIISSPLSVIRLPESDRSRDRPARAKHATVSHVPKATP